MCSYATIGIQLAAVSAKTRLVLASITLRLDYCNSVFAGLSQSTLEPLQRVQNAAARLVFDLCHRDHVSPYMMQLHWLPVRSRVQFKLCTLMHAIHNQRSPSYLSSDTVQTVATATTRCGLRSSATTDYICRAAYTFQVRRSALRVCRSRCLEPLSRSHSSPVYTCNLQKTFILKTFLFAEVFNTT